VSSLLLQPSFSVAALMTAFLSMVWPGYAILHLTGYGRHRWSAALFAGAPMTLALWVVIMSGAAWASIPLSQVSSPVWFAMLLLAAAGVALRISVWRQVDHFKNASIESSLFWIVAVSLPLAIMPSTFRFGIGIFANSAAPDAWSYLAVADYLSHVARGSEGGLPALHQYASHLMNTRNASSALLAHLAMELHVQADEVLSLFCLLVLFANCSALIAFARTAFEELRPTVSFVLIAGFAAPALIIYFSNLDQLLLLPCLPLVAAIALKAGRGNSLVGSGLALGVLIGAALFAYIEMAPLGLLVAMTFFVSPGISTRVLFIRAATTFCAAVAIAALLTWPGIALLIAMLKQQYASAQMAIRPGDGMLEGVLFRANVPWIYFGLIIATLAVGGTWFESRRWSAVIAFAVVATLVLHTVVIERYLYGAYKIATINVWMLCFFVVVGGEHFLNWMQKYSNFEFRKAFSFGPALLLLLSIAGLSWISETKFRANGIQQQRYREAITMVDIIGKAPTLISVRDDLANQWSVFYLSGVPVLINPYRIYMAAPHVLPFMKRADRVELADIRYIVTDRDDNIRTSVTGALRIWNGQTYSLWKADKNWTLTAEGGVHEDHIAISGCPRSAIGIVC
jgi:hypothetical protein